MTEQVSIAKQGLIIVALLLAVQLTTGLVIAGTDLFWPPFGHWFAQWIAAPGIDPTAIQPGNAELIDKTSYAAMRALRRPFVTVHEITFYALIILIVLRIVAMLRDERNPDARADIEAVFADGKALGQRM